MAESSSRENERSGQSDHATAPEASADRALMPAETSSPSSPSGGPDPKPPTAATSPKLVLPRPAARPAPKAGVSAATPAPDPGPQAKPVTTGAPATSPFRGHTIPLSLSLSATPSLRALTPPPVATKTDTATPVVTPGAATSVVSDRVREPERALPLAIPAVESTNRHGALTSAQSHALLGNAATTPDPQTETKDPPKATDATATVAAGSAGTEHAAGSPQAPSGSPLRAPTPPPVPLTARAPAHVASPAPAATSSLARPTDRRGLSIPPPAARKDPTSDPLSPLLTEMLLPPSVALRASVPPRAPMSRTALAWIIAAGVGLPVLVFAGALGWRMGTRPTQTIVVAAPPALTVATAAPVPQPAPVAPVVAPTPRAHGRRDTSSRARTTGPRVASNTAPVAHHTAAADANDDGPDPDVQRNACARGCNGNVDCVLHCAVSSAAAPRPTSRAAAADDDSDLPVSPSRNDVQTALRTVTDAVHRCANGRTGSASVDVTFAGSGRVTTAMVAPPFSGTPEGSCIARAVRTVQLPAFSQPFFHVNYSYRVD